MIIQKRFYSSILLLIVGGLLVKTQFVIGDGCSGMGDGILFVLLVFAYSISFLIIMVISIVKYIKHKGKFNFFPVLITLIVVTVVFFSAYSDKFESKTIFYAEMKPKGHTGRNSLTLRKNHTFKIIVGHIESVCYFKGNYILKGDTLKLLKDNIQEKTDSTFADQYIIDKNKKNMHPLDRPDFLQDTTRWLIISEDLE